MKQKIIKLINLIKEKNPAFFFEFTLNFLILLFSIITFYCVLNNNWKTTRFDNLNQYLENTKNISTKIDIINELKNIKNDNSILIYLNIIYDILDSIDVDINNFYKIPFENIKMNDMRKLKSRKSTLNKIKLILKNYNIEKKFFIFKKIDLMIKDIEKFLKNYDYSFETTIEKSGSWIYVGEYDYSNNIWKDDQLSFLNTEKIRPLELFKFMKNNNISANKNFIISKIPEFMINSEFYNNRLSIILPSEYLSNDTLKINELIEIDTTYFIIVPNKFIDENKKERVWIKLK